MTEEEFDASIRAALDFLERAGLDEITIKLSSLKVNAQYNEVALAPNSSYEEIYRQALRLNQFNIQLLDFSLFQYSWQNIASWRLAYCPNPWISGVSSALEDLDDLKAYLAQGAINTEEFLEEVATDFKLFNAIPMFRYEYSEAQYRPISHPAGHLHIGTFGDDRWAWRRKLSPKSFTMLIVRMFYPGEWNKNCSWHDPSVEMCWENELNTSLQNDGVSQEFSDAEASSVHFTAVS